MHQQQRGFTLIELIIVIVILGILAATAAPRFINIQADAVKSTMKGLSGALSSGAQLVYAKSALSGEQKNAAQANDNAQVTISSIVVDTEYGYPSAATTDFTMLNAWLDITSTDWAFIPTASSSTDTFGLSPANYTFTNWASNTCHVVYTSATSVAPATVTSSTDGC